MTPTVEEDFREFVAARWPDLEGVAFVVTLDAATARRVTARALADLHGRWREAIDDGRPGEVARRAVLGAAVAAAPGDSGSGSATAHSASLSTDSGHEDHDDMVTAMVAVVRAEPPVERALVGAASVWGADAQVVADLLGMPPAPLRDRADSLRARLTDAHTGARQAQGLGPAPWALDADVDAAVARLLRGQGDPPDPAALVTEQRRSVRRRTLVTGGAAAVALAGVGAVLVSRATSAPSTGARPRVERLAPDDARWASTAQWPARGRLAGDPAVALLLARGADPRDHVLWAGDVGTRRLVVAWTSPGLKEGDGSGMAMGMGMEATSVRVFDGPSGIDPALLQETEMPYDMVIGAGDVVAVTLPDGEADGQERSLLVVLARPTVAVASVSYVVRPTRDGTIERAWSPLPLEAGITTTTLDRSLPLAARLRVGPWEGAPAAPTSAFDQLAADLTQPSSPEWVAAHVTALTGIPAGDLATTVLVDEEIPGGMFEWPPPTDAVPGRLVSLLTTTPDGAVLRTTAYQGEGSTWPLEPSVLIPAGRQDEPFVVQVSDLRADVARFLVIAPGAERVQMISTSPDGYPVSKVERTNGRAVTVVPVVNGSAAGEYRVVTRDARGRVLFDGVPTPGRYLLDIWQQ